MATKFICYKNTVNVKQTIESGLIGSKSSTFLERIKNQDKLFLYCKKHIWAELIVSSEGFESDERIWLNEIYPYRFKVEVMRVFREPVSLEAIGVNEILRTLYGKQWSFQVLFTPRDLPEQVVNSLTKGLMEVGVINESEYVSFFEKYRFFGLGGKKLQIEMEKAKKKR